MMRQQFVSRSAGGKEGGRWARPQLEALEDRVVLDAALQGTLNFITALQAGTAVAAVQVQHQAATDLGTLQTDITAKAHGSTTVTGATLAADLQQVVTDATNLNNLSNIAQLLNNGLNQVALGALFGANGALNTQDLNTIVQDLVIGQFANSLVNTAQQAGTGALGGALGSILGTLPSGQSLFTNLGITNQGGTLTITGDILGQPFTLPITLTTTTPPTTTPTITTPPILNLQLGSLNLNVLGLEVVTSPICLSVTSQSAGPLGDLLGGLTTAVNGNTLSTFLSGLSATDLNTLLNGLTGLLSTGLSSVLAGALLNPSSTATPTNVDDPATLPAHPEDCEILSLSVGPLNLNLLGLNVQLNDCGPQMTPAQPAGPVVVDVDAVMSTNPSGQGGLLGDLLCDVSGLLNNNPLAGLGSLGQLEGALVGALLGVGGL